MTVVGDIYNRVDASPTTQYGTTRVLLGTTPASFSAYGSGSNPLAPLTTEQINTLLGQVANKGNSVQQLNPPQAGFFVKATFATLLGNSTLSIGLTPDRITDISAATPASIAKARRSCF